MLDRRSFLKTMAAGAATLQAAPAKRPNIIVMMADDMGISDLGCYGSEIATPNLDRLAKNGIRFTQFYNNARCCPTRATLMTGVYPHQAGVGHMVEDYDVPGYKGDLSKEVVTIPEVLRPAGYRTAMSGKWHVTPYKPDAKHNWPLQRGFEKYYGIINGAASYFQPASLTRDNTPIVAEGENYYLTDAIAENASKYIEEFGKGSDPFFLYVAFTSPHWPLHAMQSDIDKYKDRYNKGWDELRAERHKKMIELGIVDKKWAITPRDDSAPSWKDAENKEWYARRMAVYAAQIDRMDQNVGRILDTLAKTGKTNDTLILFLADNGGCAEELGAAQQQVYIPKTSIHGKPVVRGNNPALMPGEDETFQSYGLPWANASNTPFRLFKHWVHEGGIASPLIAHWPNGIAKKGTITHQMAHLMDVMATCVDLGKATYPANYQGNKIKPFEGKSLTPVLEGKQRAGYTNGLFWEHEGNRAMRQGKWKLVAKNTRDWELFDLDADRTELHSVADKNPDRVKSMVSMYDAWSKRAGVEVFDEVKKRRKQPARSK